MNQQINTIREALEAAQNGLKWYRDAHPGDDSGADDEMDAQLSEALAALAELEAAMREPVAWRTFDGEGGYDYRSYEDNEDYAADYVKRNGAKYADWVEPLYAAPPAQQADGPSAATVEEAARDVGKWLNERPNRPLDLRSVAMLAAHAQQAQPTESVLVDGIAYDTPAPVAAELLRLHLEGKQAQAEAVPQGLIDPGVVVSFAVARWNAEVANRPLVNVYRRNLDDVWRQVIRHFGGNPEALLGPDHDTRLQTGIRREARDGRRA